MQESVKTHTTATTVILAQKPLKEGNHKGTNKSFSFPLWFKAFTLFAAPSFARMTDFCEDQAKQQSPGQPLHSVILDNQYQNADKHFWSAPAPWVFS